VTGAITFVAGALIAIDRGSARVPWRMLAPGGASVAVAGMQFLVLDNTGRVNGDYRFITQAPPA
jgi:hypothetical protein